MPLPFLLVGAAAVAGIGTHINAKKKSEEAQNLIASAERLYNTTKKTLDIANNNTETTLVTLEISKKKVLQSSMKQFLKAYKRVKKVQIKESEGLEELSKFSLTPSDIVQIQSMTDIYESNLKVGTIGAATGVALTALTTTTLASAAGFASFLSPVAVVAAPVLLFTGISASIKAEENLEKARVMYSDTEVAVEKMKTAVTMCDAITKRTAMFDDLLFSLNKIFAECARYMDSVTRSKVGLFKGWSIKAEKINEQEMKLIAITRALAGAVKAVIDTPVLDPSGELDSVSLNKYNEIKGQMSNFISISDEVKSVNYGVKMLPARKA